MLVRQRAPARNVVKTAFTSLSRVSTFHVCNSMVICPFVVKTIRTFICSKQYSLDIVLHYRVFAAARIM